MRSGEGGEVCRLPDGSAVTAAICRAALDDGFSLAVRGAGLRDTGVAGLCAAVSQAAGPASEVGANLYVTPPNARGLAAHYDDHDVLVLRPIPPEYRIQWLGSVPWVVW